MKKFPCPLPLLAALLCAFFFSCSGDGFEKPKLPSDGLDANIVKCVVDESKPCYEISKSACDIIGGREIDPEEKCISFDCEWTSKEVDYGGRSALRFAFKSDSVAQEEGCYLEKISYADVPLEMGEHTISKNTFSDLLYSEDKSIVAKATVICGEDQLVQNCKPLKVNSVPLEFTCWWTDEEIKYGEKSTLNFAFDDPASSNIAQMEGCSFNIFPSPLDTGELTILPSTIAGLSYSKDTIITAKATVCGKSKDCSPLTVKSVPGPEEPTGDLSFKKIDYVSNDTNYFYIGTTVDTSYIRSTIGIPNKEEAECEDIKIKIEGSPTKLNTPVKATAVVTCKYAGELELRSISAEVLPNPVIKECTLGSNSQYYMHSGETLTLNVALDDVSERCKNGIRYSLDGTTFGTSLSLSNSKGKLDKIKARAECSGGIMIGPVNCPEIFVAEGYIGNARCNHESIFSANINITKATTVIEYACCEPKTDYFITCDGTKNYTFKIEGSPDVTSNNGDANLPALTLIPEPNAQCTQYGNSPGGTLYSYPKRILMTVTSGLGGGFQCDSW